MARRLQLLHFVVFTSVALAAAACGGANGANEGAAPLSAEAIQSLTPAGGTSRGLSLASEGDLVAAVWATTADGVTNIFAAVSRDAGRSFAAPVVVNDAEGGARVNGEQPPRVAIAGRDVIVVWSSRVDGKSRVRMARSTDEGRTFGSATSVHAAGLTGARGWASLAVDGDGTAHVTWLDGRNAAPRPTPAVPPVTPAASAQGGSAAPAHVHSGGSTRQDIVQAVIRRDATIEEREVAANVCFCCKTSTAVAPDGTTYVAWRHIYPVNLRDMAVARSTDGGRTFSAPVRVSEDGWQLDSCPEDGPSIAAATGVVHITWPTIAPGSTDRKAVFYSYSTDQGATFAPRIRIDSHLADGIASHPQIVAQGGRTALVWEESGSAGRVVKFTAIDRTSAGGWAAAPTGALTVSAGDSAVYPAVAATTGGFVVGWTLNSNGTSQIQIARVN